MLGWWFAFTRDIRRERTFTIDDVTLISPYAADEADPAKDAPVT